MKEIDALKRLIKLREKDIYNLVMRWDKYEGSQTRNKWVKRFKKNETSPNIR